MGSVEFPEGHGCDMGTSSHEEGSPVRSTSNEASATTASKLMPVRLPLVTVLCRGAATM